ncbi:MAG: hypothetical protein AAF678_03320 [Pseudomonadota bacterium]
MKLGVLLDQMFPGDARRGMPRFSDVCDPVDGLLDFDRQSRLCSMLDAVDLSQTDDINTVLRDLRQQDPDLMRGFIENALEAYFSAPEVMEAANGTPATLFPNARALPDIDYALLEPVYERSTSGDPDAG